MKQDIFEACQRKQDGLSNLSWNDLADLFDIPSGKILKDRFYRAKNKIKYSDNPENYSPEVENPVDYKETVRINEDGTQVSDRLVLMSFEESKSPEFILNAHGYDPELWEITNAVSNIWHTVRPDDAGLRVATQSKVTVKPKTKSGISIQDIDSYFENFNAKKLIDFSVSRQYKSGGKVVEISLADVHVGNESLPFFEVKKRIEKLIGEVKQKTIGMALEKIILAQMGDILHIDGYNRQTTSGTQVTYGSDFYTSFDDSVSLMVWVLNELASISKVDVVNIFGNHDRTSSYALAKTLEAVFKENENVSIDTSHDRRKFRKIGVSSVAFVHGDMNKKNLYSTFQKEARKLFGETEYSEIHCGHLHHEHSLEEHGVIIRYLPSITIPDEWHNDNGYTGAKQGTQCFVWDLEKGLDEIWFIGV